MEHNKKLGKDIFISELGFGAWAIGGNSYGDVAITDAKDALSCFFEYGGNFIDTAQSYAASESIIGEFLKESSYGKDAIIATKTPFGTSLENIEKIETELDKSLQRLGRDYVDLYYLHNPAEDEETIEASLDVMQSLKKKGKIKTVGASIKGVNVDDEIVALSKKYINTKKVDALQLVYSIIRQKNDEVFAYAMEHEVAIIGRTSLESGFLTGKYRKDHVFADGDHRKRWDKNYNEIISYVEQIERKYMGVCDDNMTSLAIRFAMYPEAITDTIVGVKSRKQMEEIMKICEKPQIAESIIEELVDMFDGKTELFNVL